MPIHSLIENLVISLLIKEILFLHYVCRRRKEFIDKLSVKLIAHTAGVVASHPFQVICVRMMAQFVGGEDKYRYTIHHLFFVE